MKHSVHQALRRGAALLAAAASPVLARAHEGHGMPGASHWHATDVAAFAVAAVAVALVLWLGRKK